MTVFYDRQSVLVTERMMRVDEDLYAIIAIEDVRVASRRSKSLSIVAVAALAPAPIAALSLFARGGGAIMLMIALLGLAATVSAAFTLGQLRPHSHELWIQYDGDMRRILATDEDWRVQQLARALRRAMRASRQVPLP